ncbi:MAG: hypothetical protein EXR70_21015 [Deltaproteobacteria bacterium]|nr:hypothetical protein [Deltaproteobacteria bacterium]
MASIYIAVGQSLAQSSPSSPQRANFQWQPIVHFENEIYPAFVLATATAPYKGRLSEFYRGDPRGSIGVVIKNQETGTNIRVRIEIDSIAKPTEEEFSLDSFGDYRIYPKIRYSYDTLTRLVQPRTVDTLISIEANGISAGSKSLPLRVRSVNDVPLRLQTKDGRVQDLSWMLAAFVNENHPWIDKLLQEALRTRLTSQFSGYQGTPQQVVKEINAIWTLLGQRGMRYSNIATPSGTSRTVISQHVRFLTESISFTQANCLDGTVLLASIFRKIGLDPVIVLVPGHALLKVYLDNSHQNFVYIETTLMGRAMLSDAMRIGASKFSELYRPNVGKPGTFALSIAKAREMGIVPINR